MKPGELVSILVSAIILAVLLVVLVLVAFRDTSAPPDLQIYFEEIGDVEFGTLYYDKLTGVIYLIAPHKVTVLYNSDGTPKNYYDIVKETK